MLILKNKLFDQWASDLKITDETLTNAIDDMNNGLYEANLGGLVYKKRISMDRRGKRSGARVIVAFKIREKAIFVYGFSKSKKGNLTKKEAEALKGLAKIYFSYNDTQIQHAIETGTLVEVKL